MLINLRGTHGAGKSTIVRGFLDANAARPIYGALGLRPEAYKMSFAGKTSYVIGPYETACGGADGVQPYALICPLIEKYAAAGDVIFEGALISGCWGTVGRLLERWGREAIVAFLNTPPEECVRRVTARRAQRGDARALNPANLIQKHAAIARLKLKLDAAGIVRTATVTDAADLLRQCFCFNSET
jgi:hypothetical protein